MLRTSFTRAFAFAGTTSLMATAPFQCGKEIDPGLRQEETAGDALWALSQTFADAGDRAAERRTLEFLVERYPSSRYASAARDELKK